MPALHIAPHTDGGWVVEDDARRLPPSRYDDLDEARREAEEYVAGHHEEWEVVVHEHPAGTAAGA
jgi:hypothetical protein